MGQSERPCDTGAMVSVGPGAATVGTLLLVAAIGILVSVPIAKRLVAAAGSSLVRVG